MNAAERKALLDDLELVYTTNGPLQVDLIERIRAALRDPSQGAQPVADAARFAWLAEQERDVWTSLGGNYDGIADLRKFIDAAQPAPDAPPQTPSTADDGRALARIVSDNLGDAHSGSEPACVYCRQVKLANAILARSKESP